MLIVLSLGVLAGIFVSYAIESMDKDSSELNFSYHVVSPIFIWVCLLYIAMMYSSVENYNSIKTLEVSSEQYIELRDMCVASPKTKGKAFVKAYEDGKITQQEYINIKNS